MKKSFLFLIIILCVGSLFAVTTGGVDTPITTYASTSVEVTLNLKQSDLSAYRFGFSSDNPIGWMENQDIDIVPTGSVSPLTLTFDGDTGKAILNGSVYIYYKTRTVENYELRVDISDGITYDGNKIDWIVNIGEEKALDSSKSDLYWCKNIMANSPTTLLKANIYQLTIETALIDTAMIDGVYKGTITYKITAI